MNNITTFVKNAANYAEVAIQNLDLDKEVALEGFKQSMPTLAIATGAVTVLTTMVAGPAMGIRVGATFGAKLGLDITAVSFFGGLIYGTSVKTHEALKAAEAAAKEVEPSATVTE